MGIFSPVREGTWYVRSMKDPRWNGEGRCLVGGFTIPYAAKKHIERRQEELAEEPPDDLTWEYMKD